MSPEKSLVDETAVREGLRRALGRIPEVHSVTLVGSYFCGNGEGVPRDLDVVVIVEELSERLHNECTGAVASMRLSDRRGGIVWSVLNTSFGPLKPEFPGGAVVHLMIYDILGHRSHVMASPFTCYDWERSTPLLGKRLSDVYPVLCLQPRDFEEARRGLTDYARDLRAGVVSYREYSWEEGDRAEVRRTLALDSGLSGEFSYHVMRNAVVNYCKMVERHNTVPEDLVARWKEYLPLSAVHVDAFQQLAEIKTSGSRDYPESSADVTRQFVQDFLSEVRGIWSKARRVLFVRHAPTAMNDGRFLGSRSDPPVADRDSVQRLDLEVDRVFSSPAVRARQTAEALCPSHDLVVDERLREIDYGEAEGLELGELAVQFPQIIDAWNQGQDPRFPGGENTAGVEARLWDFVEHLPREKSTRSARSGIDVVITHNVVLRCLLGRAWGISRKHWHRLRIPFCVPLEIVVLGSTLHSDMPRQTMAHIIDGWVRGG